PPTSSLFPYTTLFRSPRAASHFAQIVDLCGELPARPGSRAVPMLDLIVPAPEQLARAAAEIDQARSAGRVLVCCALGYSRSAAADRKSTRLNSSHQII